MDDPCTMSTDHASRIQRINEEAGVFKALGDEKRLRIMHMIACNPGICSCKILERFDMSQSTLSHHMKLLCTSGLVRCEKDGKWMHYTIDPKGLETAMGGLSSLRDLPSNL